MNIITSNITTHLRTQSPSIVDYCLDYRTVSFLEFSILKLYNNCSFLCIFIGSPMLWLPACARARHCIVVLFPTIQCLARAQAGNHNIGPPMVFYKHMKIQLHLIHLSNINHFAYFRAKANSLELVLLGVVQSRTQSHSTMALGTRLTMNPTQIHYS